MKTRVWITTICVLTLATVAFAHNGEEHVMGTVTQISQDAISVKTAKSVVTVAVVPATTFSKDKAAAKIADLHVGDRVVIHAKEGANEKLVADTVQFAAAPAAQPKAQTGSAK